MDRPSNGASAPARAWPSLRHAQGGDAYQSAYYVYEEISQGSSGSNPSSLNGKATAQAAQGNWPEAEAALNEASELVHFLGHCSQHRLIASQNPDFPSTVANLAAVANIQGKAPQSMELLSCVVCLTAAAALTRDAGSCSSLRLRTLSLTT